MMHKSLGPDQWSAAFAMTVGLAKSQQWVKHERILGRYDLWRLVVDLRMQGIVGFGDGVRIGRRLQCATPPTAARAKSDQCDKRKGASAHAGVGWAGFCARDHEAAPVACG
jgi:hypothetical protein